MIHLREKLNLLIFVNLYYVYVLLKATKISEHIYTLNLEIMFQLAGIKSTTLNVRQM